MSSLKKSLLLTGAFILLISFTTKYVGELPAFASGIDWGQYDIEFGSSDWDFTEDPTRDGSCASRNAQGNAKPALIEGLKCYESDDGMLAQYVVTDHRKGFELRTGKGFTMCHDVVTCEFEAIAEVKGYTIVRPPGCESVFDWPEEVRRTGARYKRIFAGKNKDGEYPSDGNPFIFRAAKVKKGKTCHDVFDR